MRTSCLSFARLLTKTVMKVMVIEVKKRREKNRVSYIEETMCRGMPFGLF